MIGVQELRSGIIYEENGNLLQVLSYEHVKMGRGSATIRVKIKNLRSGSTTEKSFINTAKVNDVTVLKKEHQYLYKDQEFAYFMNPQTFEQISVPLKVIDGDEFLKEGDAYSISFLGQEPLSVILPPKVVLTVTETAPGVKGNSATNVFKDAVLENGLTTKVPPFIGVGDKVRVDTRTGAYTEKAQ
ncbi:MAG TPA: elongation factor P [Patescibacteria group bacterium]|jgi:elongation factor P|nr:elongation factor P [Patescibacteria group bacterium]